MRREKRGGKGKYVKEERREVERGDMKGRERREVERRNI